MNRRGKNHSTWILLTVPACTGALLLSVAQADEGKTKPAEEILQSYVADFRHDPAAARPVTFGVRVTGKGGGDWHVVVAGKKPGAQEADVTLKTGLPDQPAAYYELDLATLCKMDDGETNALTAMGRAGPDDVTPMDLQIMPGFEGDASFWAFFAPFTFHFWTRGLPERVPFGGELSRVCHGANVVGFYYQSGFRSAWYQIEKGQHINKDPKDQTNPFPSMFIMIRGQAEARIGGKQLTFPASEMMLVPAGVTHEFWNPHDEPAEFIILMFGEGA